MATPTTVTELLKQQREELTKSYVALDVQSRPQYVYSCKADTPNNGACVRVEYIYADATSAIVIKMKETYSTWVSATMDI